MSKLVRAIEKLFLPVPDGKADAPPAGNSVAASEVEQIKIEYAARMEEYRAIRSEIIQNLGSQHQLITVSVTAVGALLAASKYIVEAHSPFLFVVGSWAVFGLIWMQLRYAQSNMALLNYLVEILAPEVRRNIQELSPSSKRDVSSVLRAEQVMRTIGYSREAWELPLEGSRYGITLIAATVSYIAYIVIRLNQSGLSWYDLPLSILQCVLTIYTIFAVTKVRCSFLSKRKIYSADSAIVLEQPN